MESPSAVPDFHWLTSEVAAQFIFLSYRCTPNKPRSCKEKDEPTVGFWMQTGMYFLDHVLLG